jgi:serine/threonine protein phosphatase PrpC
MQGWRKKMEDSHISDMGLGPQNNIHIFGVFDGHGGKNSFLEVL